MDGSYTAHTHTRTHVHHSGSTPTPLIGGLRFRFRFRLACDTPFMPWHGLCRHSHSMARFVLFWLWTTTW